MRQVLPGLLLGLVVACGDATLAPLPLAVTIEVSRTSAAPGDSISFLVSAQGGALVGVEADYGDDVSESYGTSGARTAHVSFRHAYSVRGVYQMRATVTDALAGQKNASVEIRVQ